MSNTGGMKILGRILLGMLILVFFGYGGLKTRNLVSGPKISIDNLKDGMTIPGEYLTLTGTARNSIALSINGATVPTDRSGAFSYELLVPPGYSIITVSAEDRFKKQVSQVYRVIGPQVVVNEAVPVVPTEVSEENSTDATVTETPDEEITNTSVE